MASHFRLYERPLVMDEIESALTVTGELEGYTSGEPYESRLQINNSIGRCTVEIIEASLPPGAAVRVDNVTKEVVVKWDAYTVVADELNSVPNGDFEEGDNGQWSFGNGWSIQAGGAETGTYAGVFHNFKGTASIESVRVPYTPGTPITASCRFQQGASSKGNLTGRILLIWCDENGNMIPGGEGISWAGGNLIRSGSRGEWKTSTVTAASRAAVSVAAGFSAHRKKQNLLARVDNFTWNHKYTLGQVGDDVYFLHIKVTDSLNRVAYWKGAIEEYGVYLTSQLYPFYEVESLTSSPDYGEWRNTPSPTDIVDVRTIPSMVSFTITSIRKDYNAGAEAVATVPAFLAFDIRVIRKDYDAGAESVLTTPGFLDFEIKEQPKTPIEVSGVQTTPSFISWSIE